MKNQCAKIDDSKNELVGVNYLILYKRATDEKREKKKEKEEKQIIQDNPRPFIQIKPKLKIFHSFNFWHTFYYYHQL